VESAIPAAMLAMAAHQRLILTRRNLGMVVAQRRERVNGGVAVLGVD
jgi:hypothetical protein